MDFCNEGYKKKMKNLLMIMALVLIKIISNMFVNVALKTALVTLLEKDLDGE